MHARIILAALSILLLSVGLVLWQVHGIASVVERGEHPLEVNTTMQMPPQNVHLMKEWDSPGCGHVVVETWYRDQEHPNETYAEFVARHNTAVAAMMVLCPAS